MPATTIKTTIPGRRDRPPGCKGRSGAGPGTRRNRQVALCGQGDGERKTLWRQVTMVPDLRKKPIGLGKPYAAA